MLLLQILKWILWIVLWILLVILLLLLLILFVPVRYRLEGEYSEKKKCFLGKISWFLSLVSITIHYGEALVRRIKILGITIYDSSRPGKPKKEKPETRKKKGKLEKRKNVDRPEKRRKKEKKSDQKTGEKQKSQNAVKGNASLQPQILKEEADLAKDHIPEEEAVPGEKQALGEEAGFRQEHFSKKEMNFSQEKSLKEKNDFNREQLSKENVGKHILSGESRQQNSALLLNLYEAKEQNSSERKSGFWDKLKGIKQKFLGIIEKLKSIWQSVDNKLDLIRYYYQLWKKEDTQTAWNKAKTRLGKSIVPFVPRKWTVTGIVGFDDPSTTGQMMAVIGMAYPIHGGNLIITPDFEESRMELKVTARGKITSGVILYHFLHILCDKDCRTLIKLLLAGRPAKEQDEVDPMDEADRTDGNNKNK